MSVLRKVGLASGLLRIAGSAVRDDNVAKLLRDANTFVTSSRDAIEHSAPHIYLSALPFSAKDSLVYKTFSGCCGGIIAVNPFGTDRPGSRLTLRLTGLESTIDTVVYFPDGRQIVSSSTDGVIRFWDARTGEETIPPLRSPSSIHSLLLAKDGRRIIAGIGDGTVNVWSLNAGHVTLLQQLHGHTGPIRSIKHSLGDSVLTIASFSKISTHIWNAERSQYTPSLQWYLGDAIAVTFSSDGETLASCSNDGSVRLWNSATGEPTDQLPQIPHGPICLVVSFSPDGGSMALGYDTGMIRIWELQSRGISAEFPKRVGPIRSLAFSPDGHLLAAGSDDTRVRLWDLRHDASESAAIILEGHTNRINSVIFSPDELFIVSASEDCAIRIWDASSGGHSTLAAHPLSAHDGAVNSVAIRPDGSAIVSGSNDCAVRVWDALTGKLEYPPLLGHAAPVYSVAISPDGRLVASASRDRTVRLWDLPTGEAVNEPLKEHEGFVTTTVFSPDSQWLATGSYDKSVRLWNVATGKTSTVNPAPDFWVTAVAFSPDGRLLAAGGAGGHIHFWHSATGQRACQPLRTSAHISSIAISPAGTHVVFGGYNMVCILDIAAEHEARVFKSHDLQVNSVAYSADGHFIVSGSDDKTIGLWDATTGARLAKLHEHGGSVSCVKFTLDGQSIVSCSRDKTIRIWNMGEIHSSTSGGGSNCTAALVSATPKDGWLLGPSGELLLWVPVEYRHYLQIPPYTMVIGSLRIVVTAVDDLLHRGENWTRCWRNNPLSDPCTL